MEGILDTRSSGIRDGFDSMDKASALPGVFSGGGASTIACSNTARRRTASFPPPWIARICGYFKESCVIAVMGSGSTASVTHLVNISSNVMWIRS